jgi:hypothetical protein
MGNVPISNCHCDYTKYKDQISRLNSDLKTANAKYDKVNSELIRSQHSSRTTNATVDQLKSVCLIKGSTTIEQAGKKIFELLTDRYKDSIKVLDTQQSLLDKQNNILGSRDVKLAEQKDELRKLKLDIHKNNRLLSYKDEGFKHQNKIIDYLKIGAYLSIVILGLYIAMLIFIKTRK